MKQESILSNLAMFAAIDTRLSEISSEEVLFCLLNHCVISLAERAESPEEIMWLNLLSFALSSKLNICHMLSLVHDSITDLEGKLNASSQTDRPAAP